MAHGKRSDAKSIAKLERQEQVLRLRKRGYSLRAIGIQLGVSHVTVGKDLDEALARLIEDNKRTTEQWRALELERLDDMTVTLYSRAVGKDADDNGIDRMLKIIETRSKLLGLNAPVQTETSGEIVVKVAYDGTDDIHR